MRVEIGWRRSPRVWLECCALAAIQRRDRRSSLTCIITPRVSEVRRDARMPVRLTIHSSDVSRESASLNQSVRNHAVGQVVSATPRTTARCRHLPPLLALFPRPREAHSDPGPPWMQTGLASRSVEARLTQGGKQA